MENLISEWCSEGYEYLYEEKPSEMKELEQYLSECKENIVEIYRRTDYHKFLDCKKDDVLELDRVTSWSKNFEMPDQRYEGEKSVKFILSSYNADQGYVKGRDVSQLSPHKSEKEVMLAPCKLTIMEIKDDIAIVKYV